MLISQQFWKRLRRFADWSWNGPEYLRLLEIEQGLADLIFQEKKHDQISLEEWLCWWARVVAPVGGATYNEIPFWLKILPQIFFLAINNSVSGIISKKELESFYGSVVGLDSDKISKYLDMAYNSLTSVKTLYFYYKRIYNYGWCYLLLRHLIRCKNSKSDKKKRKIRLKKKKKNDISYKTRRGHEVKYKIKWENGEWDGEGDETKKWKIIKIIIFAFSSEWRPSSRLAAVSTRIRQLFVRSWTVRARRTFFRYNRFLHYPRQ